ncbi:MAG: TetR/AcrR family transcriptional regulator [Shimia sp.]
MSDAKSLVRKKTNYHHGDLRGQLIEAVRELVEEKGLDGFSIAEACRKAGVSTAAPYKHFKDRSDILRGAVLQAMVRLYDGMQAAADAYPAGDPRRLVELGTAYLTFARAEPGMFKVMFSLTDGHDDDPALTRAGDAANGLVEQLVAEHLDVPRDHPAVHIRAYALWCVVHGHAFLQMDGKVPEDASFDEAALLSLCGEGIVDRNAKAVIG